MGKLLDLTGQKFGRLTVIERTESTKGHTKWKCKCDCGNQTIVDRYNLLSGCTKSCGCYSSELTAKRNHKHGKRNTRLYNIWANMKERCYNKQNHKYAIYGARGITVCDEWQEFAAFYDWAIQNGYADDLTIDRKDVNGNYEPSNCRWATQKEQQNNKRQNHPLTYNGKTQTISQWADERKIKYGTLYARLFVHQWSVEKALTKSVRR